MLKRPETPNKLKTLLMIHPRSVFYKKKMTLDVCVYVSIKKVVY